MYDIYSENSVILVHSIISCVGFDYRIITGMRVTEKQNILDSMKLILSTLYCIYLFPRCHLKVCLEAIYMSSYTNILRIVACDCKHVKYFLKGKID